MRPAADLTWVLVPSGLGASRDGYDYYERVLSRPTIDGLAALLFLHGDAEDTWDHLHWLGSALSKSDSELAILLAPLDAVPGRVTRSWIEHHREGHWTEGIIDGRAPRVWFGGDAWSLAGTFDGKPPTQIPRPRE